MGVTWGRGMRRKRVEKPMARALNVCTVVSIECMVYRSCVFVRMK